LNTGGMGAYSPAPVVTSEIHNRVMEEIIYPTVRGMAAEGNPYKGFLYAGLMIMPNGQPKVIEFNCRFGDPETQPIMMRMKSDLVELCLKACKGKLDQIKSEWIPQPALGIVLAAEGYPNDYRKGDEITGLPSENKTDEKVFLAGVAEQDGKLLTNGGRVLCATALGDSVFAAQQKALKLAAQIQWTGRFYRRDIGYRAIAREQNK
ncbi:MAG TPA: phosphoribosylamine--glycine ligase, partial [Pasteurellaceae bacterium]|nr:phosphoribosylamine--glycine ligase [Pasteurellaceae bacterium]